MTTLYVAPGCAPTPIETSFSDIQETLGIVSFAYPFEDEDVCIAFDDDGIANERQPNRTLNGQIIPGPFYVIGVTPDGKVTDLPSSLLPKYQSMFAVPEEFPEGRWKVTTKVEERPYAAVIKIVSEWVATDVSTQTLQDEVEQKRVEENQP